MSVMKAVVWVSSEVWVVRRWVIICPCKGEAYVFSRVVHTTRDVVVVEINCTRVAYMDPTIALRSNWSFMN